MKKQHKRGTSVSLSKEEKAALKLYRTGFVTEVECALSIGIDRNVLSRVMGFGSGSPETIAKIKAALKANPELATSIK
jgi:predicted DNA-binding protein (UPF0251 family)